MVVRKAAVSKEKNLERKQELERTRWTGPEGSSQPVTRLDEKLSC